VTDHITIELIPPVNLTFMHFSTGVANSKIGRSKIVGARVELKLAKDDLEFEELSKAEDNFMVTIFDNYKFSIDSSPTF
jgi:hypothetical protein